MSDELIGCGDNSCIFKQLRPGGMGTNGGCRCFKDLEAWVDCGFGHSESNHVVVRKVMQDTERLSGELRRARQQVADLEAQVADLTGAVNR